MIYEPMAGSHINTVAKEAAALAQKTNRRVLFVFNGQTVVVGKSHNPARVARRVMSGWGQPKKPMHWKDRAAQKVFDAKIAADNKLARELAQTVDWEIGRKDEFALISWLKSFAGVSQWINNGVDYLAVVKKLEDAGYERGANCGQPPEFYEVPTNMAGYIIGQTIDCMMNGVPPHQVTERFCEDYFKAMQPRAPLSAR